MRNRHYRFDAIGTSWNVDLPGTIPAGRAERLMRTVYDRIERYDAVYSRFRKDSIVTAMSAKPGRYALPADAGPLMDVYHKLYRATGGLVTPLIGNMLAAAGYDAEYSLKPGIIQAPPAWDGVLDYDFPNMTMRRPALLDFGAAGKGYLVDIVGNLLEEQGVQEYCVDAGGDMAYRAKDARKLVVGLEHPADPTMAVGTANLHNQSICGSSGNRRAWGKYHHIMNPVSLDSPRHIAAVWVVADSGLIADGVSTALFFSSPETVSEYFDFEYAIVRHDLSLDVSPRFPGSFFTHASKPAIGVRELRSR